MPGKPAGLADDLLQAALAHAAGDPRLEAVHAALHAAADGQRCARPAHGKLYFGPVENFAGLERPYTLVSGMQHLEYSIHRIETDGWTGERLDPRMYLAATRCTVALSMVEMQPARFGSHYSISEVLGMPDNDSSIVPLIGEVIYDDVPKTGHQKEARPFYREVGRPAERLGVAADPAGSTTGELDFGAEFATLEACVADPKAQEPWALPRLAIANMHEGAGWPANLSAQELILAYDGALPPMLGLNELQQERLEVLELKVDEGTPAGAANVLPDELMAGIGGLQALYCNHARIEPLVRSPELFVQKEKLVHLDLSHNGLTSLELGAERDLALFPALRVLNVRWNQLAELPSWLEHSTKLERLTASHNKLEHLPQKLNTLGKLQHIIISDNRDLDARDLDFSTLTELKSLWMKNCAVTRLSKTIWALENLETVMLSGNKQDRETVMLSGNKLVLEMPDGGAVNSGIKELNLANTGLEAIPDVLLELQHIEELTLNGNQLSCTDDDKRVRMQKLFAKETIVVLQLSSCHLAAGDVPTPSPRLRSLTLNYPQQFENPAELWPGVEALPNLLDLELKGFSVRAPVTEPAADGTFAVVDADPPPTWFTDLQCRDAVNWTTRVHERSRSRSSTPNPGGGRRSRSPSVDRRSSTNAPSPLSAGRTSTGAED